MVGKESFIGTLTVFSVQVNIFLTRWQKITNNNNYNGLSIVICKGGRYMSKLINAADCETKKITV